MGMMTLIALDCVFIDALVNLFPSVLLTL